MDTTVLTTNKPYVYALAYPESMGGVVFYIGKGTRNRINDHEQEAGRGVQSYKCNVIRKVWHNGYEIKKEILAYFETHEEAFMYEIALIFFMDGLTNKTAGGNGIVGLERTKEHNRKIGEAHRGMKRSEKACQNISLGAKKRPYRRKSLEHRTKIGIAHKGRPRTEKQIAVTIARSVKTYTGFIAPDGKIPRDITNLAAFCRMYRLDAGHMIKVYRGEYMQHKGWRRFIPKVRIFRTLFDAWIEYYYRGSGKDEKHLPVEVQIDHFLTVATHYNFREVPDIEDSKQVIFQYVTGPHPSF